MESIQKILEKALCKACKISGYTALDISIKPCSHREMGDYTYSGIIGMAKALHGNAKTIASKIIRNFSCKEVSSINFVNGYINITLSDTFLSSYIPKYVKNIKSIVSKNIEKQKIIVDYGGANVAKPLHVGHLRSANIGESIKRICKFVGNEVLGDTHLGDWGLQMGMIITELHHLHPDWTYFKNNFHGEYPKESLITLKDLNTLYLNGSKHAKEDSKIMDEARKDTFKLQQGNRGYLALWKKFTDISKADIKKQYDGLNVSFELWLGESDSQAYCSKVIDFMKKKKICHESSGALIIDVDSPSDKKKLPPLILVKSDGGILYSTTELATILMRKEKFNPDRIIYVVDSRQELHFKQVFRCIEKSNILHSKIKLDFAGFGTIDGKDGKPYKTREGGVMPLKTLLKDIKEVAKRKVEENALKNKFSAKERNKIITLVALSALKFADLSIFRAKDYIFDMEKFCSFYGKTGPYLLYTITRMKSILAKEDKIDKTFNIYEESREIALILIRFDGEILSAYEDLAPSILCNYAYELANAFNTFYEKTNVLKQKNKEKRASFLMLIRYILNIMEKCLDLLGIKYLSRM